LSKGAVAPAKNRKSGHFNESLPSVNSETDHIDISQLERSVQ